MARLLALDYSPGQVAGRLRREHPGEAAMRVSHETIYQALFVQGKGSLRAEVAEAVRCVRARKRRPRTGNHTGRTRIAGLVSISERPAEADDRAVPGHWEGCTAVPRWPIPGGPGRPAAAGYGGPSREGRDRRRTVTRLADAAGVISSPERGTQPGDDGPRP